MSDEDSDREVTAAEFMYEIETRMMALMVIMDFRRSGQALDRIPSLKEIDSVLRKHIEDPEENEEHRQHLLDIQESLTESLS